MSDSEEYDEQVEPASQPRQVGRRQAAAKKISYADADNSEDEDNSEDDSSNQSSTEVESVANSESDYDDDSDRKKKKAKKAPVAKKPAAPKKASVSTKKKSPATKPKPATKKTPAKKTPTVKKEAKREEANTEDIYDLTRQVSSQSNNFKIDEESEDMDRGLFAASQDSIKLSREDSENVDNSPAANKKERAPAKKKEILSTMPLMLAKPTKRKTLLCQMTDQQLNLKGDVGAIGRLKVDEEDESILLDLKGNCYKGQFQECHSFMIVSIGQAEATVEDVIDEFVPLEYVSNIFDSEITTGNVFDYNAGMKDLDHDENEEWRAEAAENRRNKKKASKAASTSTKPKPAGKSSSKKGTSSKKIKINK